METRVLHIQLTEDRCFGECFSEPMTFAIFQAFEVFQLLTILRLFDNFSTDLPPPPSSPLYLTKTWAALVDESVHKLV